MKCFIFLFVKAFLIIYSKTVKVCSSSYQYESFTQYTLNGTRPKYTRLNSRTANRSRVRGYSDSENKQKKPKKNSLIKKINKNRVDFD